MILRALLLLLGGAALTAAVAMERPDNLAVTVSCALLSLVVAAGAIAADAVPLRRLPLACSVLTVPCAVLLLARTPWQALPAAGIVVLQLVAVAGAVAARRAGGAGPAPAPGD